MRISSAAWLGKSEKGDSPHRVITAPGGGERNSRCPCVMYSRAGIVGRPSVPAYEYVRALFARLFRQMK